MGKKLFWQICLNCKLWEPFSVGINVWLRKCLTLWITSISEQHPLFSGSKPRVVVVHRFDCRGGPRYSRTFYLRLHFFTLEKWSKMTILQTKIGFLFANSRFAVQNDRKYLPWITRETPGVNPTKLFSS